MRPLAASTRSAGKCFGGRAPREKAAIREDPEERWPHLKLRHVEDVVTHERECA